MTIHARASEGKLRIDTTLKACSHLRAVGPVGDLKKPFNSAKDA